MPISDRLPHIFYGGDYNPEQWPEQIWLEDARLMREAGVNLVSLAVFSWARIEPRPGEHDFDWLDRVMDVLHEHGVMANLATATASPPPWLAKRHPESLPVTADGVTLWPGARQHYCPSSDAYRSAAGALVRQMAGRYADHPALAMWHVNNEYGCHVAECYCERSAEAFRDWLERRYRDVERLNDAWGTAFWSQRYDDFSEVNPPRRAPTFPNPTQQLDFRRFSSDALLECYEMERAILAELAPGVPVTTNFMGFFKPVDYWKWAEREDVVSEDAYPDPADPRAPVDAAMRYDLMRSLGKGSPWILMEQAPSSVNWRPRNVPKRPRQMRAWSYQALARGADGIMFFQWRASKAGAEKYHGAMVPHAGTDSRVWREVRELGQELARLDPLLGARGAAAAAVAFDWESWWALELNSKPSADVRMLDQLRSYYEPLYRANVAVDFVHPEGDLSPYRLLLVPNLYLVTDAAAAGLERFVAGGGTLVMSFFSGVVDEDEHVRLGDRRAPFRRLLGLTVEESDPYVPGQANELALAGGGSARCDLWSDVIDLEGAEPLATYGQDYYAGRAAITRHRFQSGLAYYLGTRPAPELMDSLLREACLEAGVSAPLEVPPGVEVVRRQTSDASYLVVINHGPDTATVVPASQGPELLSGTTVGEALELERFGVAVLEEARAA